MNTQETFNKIEVVSNLPKYRTERVTIKSATHVVISDLWYVQVFESRPLFFGNFRKEPAWYNYIEWQGSMEGPIGTEKRFDSFEKASEFIKGLKESDYKYAEPHTYEKNIIEA